MRFRNFVFFRPPDDDHSGRHQRLSHAPNELPELPGDTGIRDSSRAFRREPAWGTAAPLSQLRIRSPLEHSEKLDLIRRKIASGYYRTPGHLEELADVLMEKIDFFHAPGDLHGPSSDDQ